MNQHASVHHDSGLPETVRIAIAAHRRWLDSNGKVGARAELRDCDLRDCDLGGVELSGADLAGADLRGARLDKGRFRLTCLRGAHLDGVSARDTSFEGADLDRASFDRARIAGSRFDPMPIVTDDGAATADHPTRLVGARFRRASIADTSFRGADLKGVSFDQAELTDCDFDGARMEPEAWHRARLSGCRVSETGSAPAFVLPEPEGLFGNLSPPHIGH